MRTSVIIPTYNRPEELRRCIESIIGQTVKPDELIIVDDGYLDELPCLNECENAGICYIYLRKEPPGLTASRNAGINKASGDIVFFFDDDVVLFPDYFQETLNIYFKDTDGKVGGVGGAIDNNKPLRITDKVRRLFERLFLVTGSREGEVLSSGFCTNFGDTDTPIGEPAYVDFLSGGVSSFRKEVFKEFQFNTDHYLRYGMGEDKDFSYRVSKKYRLVYTPRARLLHLESPAMSPNLYRKARMYINFVHIFFRDNVCRSPLHWVVFYYALTGYTLSKALILLISPNKNKYYFFKGVLAGISDVILKRGTIVS